MHILITGNIADGFKHIGPFESVESANEYADEKLHRQEWWMIELLAPFTKEEPQA